MAYSSNLKKIPLEANCDLTRFNQDIHPYTGFAETNSLFMNKRIVNWLTRDLNDGELVDELRYEVNGDNFDIYKNDVKKFSISRDAYKLEEVETVPEGLKEVKPIYTGNFFKSPTGEMLGTDEFKKLTAGDYTVYVTDGKIHCYKGNEFINTFDTISNFSFESLICSFVLGSTDLILNYNSRFPFLKENVPYFIFQSNSKEIKNFKASNYEEDKNGCTIINILTGETFSGNSTGFITIGEGSRITNTRFCLVPYTDNCLLLLEQLLDTGTFRYTIYNQDFTLPSVYPETGSFFDPVYISSQRQDSDIVRRTPASDEYSNVNIRKTARLSSLSLSSGTVVRSWDMKNTTIIYKNECVDQRHNVSKKYGTFAINFLYSKELSEYIPENVAHNYKKLSMLVNGMDSIIGYTDSEFYFSINDTKYKLSIEKLDNPTYQRINGNYVIFNTTSYINAYGVHDDNTFCANDDWNNRNMFWLSNIYSGTKTTDIRGTARLGNNFQNETIFSTVSGAYDSTDTVAKVFNNNVVVADNHAYYLDETYTAPEGVDYTVYMEKQYGLAVPSDIIKQGYVNSEGFTEEKDDTDIWVDHPENDKTENPYLLMTNYLVFETSFYVKYLNSVYKMVLLPNAGNKLALMYTMQEESFSGAAFNQFVINGSVYIHNSEAENIQDENGKVICNTAMFQYIGYSSKVAYFYCNFDKHIYVFTGSNTMERLETLERYNVKYGSEGIQTITLPSLNLLVINLTDRIGVIYGDQFCIIDMGEEINTMDYDSRKGTFTINKKMFSLVNQDFTDLSVLPIKIETEYYGAEGTKTNMINDCVYITVDNLNMIQKEGNLKLKVRALVNQQIKDSKEKIFTLKPSDFNANGVCLIKWQPEIQEAYGYKLFIESDLEIHNIEIGVSPGAVTQTTYRI